MIFVFWLAASLLTYTLVGYPVLLWLVSLQRSRPHRRAPIQPFVSIIIAAHNEAHGIPKKILDCLALDYSRKKFELIVASDGSSDNTAEIVRSFAGQGVKLIEIRERGGKQYAQLLA